MSEAKAENMLGSNSNLCKLPKKVWYVNTNVLSNIARLLYFDISPQVQKVYDGKMIDLIASTAVSLHDQYYFGLRGGTASLCSSPLDSPLLEALNTIRTIKTSERQIGAESNLKCEVLLVPAQHYYSNITYIIPDFDYDLYAQVFNRHPNFSSFNTDDSTSKDNMDSRHVKILQELNPTGCWDVHGFRFKLVHEDKFWNKTELEYKKVHADIMASAATVNKRARTDYIIKHILNSLLYLPSRLKEGQMELRDFIWSHMKHDCNISHWDMPESAAVTFEEIKKFVHSLVLKELEVYK